MKLISLDALINQITKKPNFILFEQNSNKSDLNLRKINSELAKNFETILRVTFIGSFLEIADEHAFRTNPFYFFNYNYTDNEVINKVHVATEFLLNYLLKIKQQDAHLIHFVENILYEMYQHSKQSDFFIINFIDDLENIIKLSSRLHNNDLLQRMAEFTKEKDRRKKDIIANAMRLEQEDFIKSSYVDENIKQFYFLFTSKKNIVQINLIINQFKMKLSDHTIFSYNHIFNDEIKVHNFEVSRNMNKYDKLFILKHIIQIFNDIKVFNKKKKLILIQGMSGYFGDFSDIINSSDISISFILGDPIDSENLVNIKDIYFLDEVNYMPYANILENQIKEYKLNSYKLN
jgi:hypothetical protein